MEPLTVEELRVLGCLAEKEVTVPDAYPLTLNALRQACNQSSSRDPVVAYDDLTIQRALDSLKAKGLVRFVHPASGERATKFRHVAHDVLELGPSDVAVLSVLVLRGPQTSGEIRTRTERQHRFESLEEVEATLRSLAAREEPLALELPRQPGRHQIRWVHLLGGPVDVDALSVDAGPPATGERRASLEAEVADLRSRVERLERELGLDAPPGYS